MVERLSGRASILKMNENEVRMLSTAAGIAEAEITIDAVCAFSAARLGTELICVSMGAKGCCVLAGIGYRPIHK